jgi:hypothetical protein
VTYNRSELAGVTSEVTRGVSKPSTAKGFKRSKKNWTNYLYPPRRLKPRTEPTLHHTPKKNGTSQQHHLFFFSCPTTFGHIWPTNQLSSTVYEPPTTCPNSFGLASVSHLTIWYFLFLMVLYQWNLDLTESNASLLPSYNWHIPIVYIGVLDRHLLNKVTFPPEDMVSHFQLPSLLLASSTV